MVTVAIFSTVEFVSSTPLMSEIVKNIPAFDTYPDLLILMSF